MSQLDLFPSDDQRVQQLEASESLDLPGVLERLSAVCERPRYSFMVLNLIAKASAPNGQAGPYIRQGNRRIPVRDWICEALVPVAQRDPRRRPIADKVRTELAATKALPSDPEAANELIELQGAKRIRSSGRTNVSRAVSELVRAGLVRRHYQGYRVDHRNRGAQRQAVYTVTEEAHSRSASPIAGLAVTDIAISSPAAQLCACAPFGKAGLHDRSRSLGARTFAGSSRRGTLRWAVAFRPID